MTHKDIYTKFMIEYDKANVTSSYPSLTEYEVATILDKAYKALIAQKLTGNNQRRAPFEGDIKAVTDVEPLIAHADPVFFDNAHAPAINIAQFKLPEDLMYFVSTMLNSVAVKASSGGHLPETEVYNPGDIGFEDLDKDEWVNYNELYADSPSTKYVERSDVYYGAEYIDSQNATYTEGDGSTANINPYDKLLNRLIPVRLVPHGVAEKFYSTPYNLPWVKIPVCYIENGTCYVVYDAIKKPAVEPGSTAHLVYIKKPKSFVDNLIPSNVEDPEQEEHEYVEPEVPSPTISSTPTTDPEDSSSDNTDDPGDNPSGDNTGTDHSDNPGEDNPGTDPSTDPSTGTIMHALEIRMPSRGVDDVDLGDNPSEIAENGSVEITVQSVTTDLHNMSATVSPEGACTMEIVSQGQTEMVIRLSNPTTDIVLTLRYTES